MKSCSENFYAVAVKLKAEEGKHGRKAKMHSIGDFGKLAQLHNALAGRRFKILRCFFATKKETTNAL